MKNFSIKNKIIAVVLIVNMIVIGLGFSIVMMYDIQSFQNEMVYTSSTKAKLVGIYCSSPLDFKKKRLVSDILVELKSIPIIESAIVFDDQDSVFAQYRKSKIESSLEIPNISKLNTHFDDNHLHLVESISFNNKHLGKIYFQVSKSELQAKMSKYLITMILLSACSFLLAYILAFWLQRIISRPILKLADVTKIISNNNDYNLRVQKEGNDETGILYDGFNNMLSVIQDRELQRDKAVTEFKESEERFKNISSAANDAIIVLDENGQVTFWNKAAENTFGYTEQEVMGTNMHQILSQPNLHFQIFEGLKNFKNTGKGSIIGKTIEMKALRKGGNEFDAELSISATRIKDRWHSIGIVKDITKRKEVEEHLRLAKQKAEESDHLKLAFLANMSHEIRTPMNAIIGFTDLMRRPEIQEDKKKQFINIIHKNNNILLKLIDDILDISKIEAGQIMLVNETFSPDEILVELFEITNREKQSKEKFLVELRLMNSIQEMKNVTVNTDRLRLRQILSNLLNNALKFTENGYVEFGYHIVDNEIVFFVTDTGIGIEPEKLAVVFDRFRQADSSTSRRFGGTGLGLAISKGLVDLLGGKIWLESTFSKGTTFYVSMNCQYSLETPVTTTLSAPTDRKYDWSDKIILIAEDEESNVDLLCEALVDTKVQLIVVNDGKPAVEMCKQNDKIDLVLMDLQMPQMDGYESTRRIKQFRKNLPIVAQTAFAMEGEKEKSLDAGCIDYITKPLNIKELHFTISKYINIRNG